jgi:hypothetical protein
MAQCGLVISTATLVTKEPDDSLSNADKMELRNFIVSSLSTAIETGAFEEALP